MWLDTNGKNLSSPLGTQVFFMKICIEIEIYLRK